MEDYNKKYYEAAVKALEDMKHYSGDMIGDCVKYLLRYFPNADKDDLRRAVNWALADTWGGGCEYETI